MTCAPTTVRTPAVALRPQLSWLVNLSFLTLKSATFSKYVCQSLPHEGCTTGLCYDMHCQYARIAPVSLRIHGHQTRPGSSLRHRIDPHRSASRRVTPSHTESQCVLITSFSLGYPLSSRSAANYTRPPLYSYAFIFSCPSTRCCGFSASPVSSKFFSRCRLNPLDLTAGYGKTSRESAIRHFTQHR